MAGCDLDKSLMRASETARAAVRVAPNRKLEPKMSTAVLKQVGDMRELDKCIRVPGMWITG